MRLIVCGHSVDWNSNSQHHDLKNGVDSQDLIFWLLMQTCLLSSTALIVRYTRVQNNAHELTVKCWWRFRTFFCRNKDSFLMIIRNTAPYGAETKTWESERQSQLNAPSLQVGKIAMRNHICFISTPKIRARSRRAAYIRHLTIVS